MGALRHASALIDAYRAARLEQSSAYDLRELSRVGVALSTERDLDTLLEMILIAGAAALLGDAGSLYLVERDGDGDAGDTCGSSSRRTTRCPTCPFSEFTIPIDHASLAGYVAATGEPLVIARRVPAPRATSPTARTARSTRSSATARSRCSCCRCGRTATRSIGVLQLINRKRDAEARLASPDDGRARGRRRSTSAPSSSSRALAAQAAVAIENSRLYEDIERLFEGFVTAAVTAIESRDPTTSRSLVPRRRRSRRTSPRPSTAVASGPYRDVRFTARAAARAPLRRAAARLRQGRRARAGAGEGEEALRRRPRDHAPPLRVPDAAAPTSSSSASARSTCCAHRRDGYADAVAQLDAHPRAAGATSCTRFLDAIVRANEPTVLPEGDASSELAASTSAPTWTSTASSGRCSTDDELRFLMIRKGNLDDARAPRDRVPRDAHLPVPRADPVDARAAAASRRSRSGTTRSSTARATRAA